MSRKVKDTELYDILNVTPEATDLELKKSYRKLAIQWHPDKNTSPEAEGKFKEIGEAYQILSDPDKRAFYDKVGKAGMNQPENAMEDPQEIFSKIFGGEAFFDYIGEIALVKDFTTTMDVVMTPEERAEMEAAAAAAETETNPSSQATSVAPSDIPTSSTSASTTAADSTTAPSAAFTTSSLASSPAPAATATPGPDAPTPDNQSLAHHSSFSSASPGSSTPIGSSQVGDTKPGAGSTLKDKKGKPKLTPEQKAKLDALEAEKEAERKKRIDDLTAKLIQRIRPFVEAKRPGDPNDPETKVFEARMRTEAEDLKLESFGVEMLQTIGSVYTTRADNFIKSKKFFGGGFLGRMKEKGTMVKEGWNLLGSAIGVQSAMQEMERLEAKGGATEEQIAALAEELTSKMMLTTWRATRWEVINILGPVVDNVLKAPGLSNDVAMKRAMAILTIGRIFKAVQADELDDERRELERLVQNAAGKKKSKVEKEKRSGWGWGTQNSGSKQQQDTVAAEANAAAADQKENGTSASTMAEKVEKTAGDEKSS